MKSAVRKSDGFSVLALLKGLLLERHIRGSILIRFVK